VPPTSSGLTSVDRRQTRTGGSRIGLVDRVRVMVFPIIGGETGEGPAFADLPDLDLRLTSTRVIDERLVLLDY
jgi:hypothetical protein